jgi:hypothetical protein
MAYCASAPGDYDDGEIGGMIGRGNHSEKTCLSATLSTTNPACCPDANPGRCGGKPASNRLSYGTAEFLVYCICFGHWSYIRKEGIRIVFSAMEDVVFSLFKGYTSMGRHCEFECCM